MNSSNLKHWLSRGDLDKLENVVLEGRGSRLLGEQSPDLRTRVFLKGLPNYLTKISQTHDAVVRGSLAEVQRLVNSEPKKKLVIAKDSAGTPLIHKAVYYDHEDVLEWIVKNYPSTVSQKDREGRTALHYCAACRDPEAAWDILIDAGCDASTCDKRGNPAAYYLQRGSEVELPDPERMTSRRMRNKDPAKWNTNQDIKPSNIRIWIHNRDIGKLQHVLWEGHGSKLRCETSNNIRVKRFLDAVPFIMVTIKDLHTATIKNDIDDFRRKIGDPVLPIILSSKDSNGLNVLHKAAGLGQVDLAREILDRYPSIVNAPDNDGKTPLHYAAACRDGGVMYDLMVEYGADESIVDIRQKTAAFYKNRPADIDPTSLVVIPDAPRVSGTSYPRHWDWRIIDSDLPTAHMKRTGNNADDDSAFGSAESAKLVEDVVTPEIENVEDVLNGNEEAEEEEEEKPEEEEEEPTAEGEDENENPAEEGEEPAAEENPETDDNNNNEEGEATAEAEEAEKTEEEADPEAGKEEEAPPPVEEEVPAEAAEDAEDVEAVPAEEADKETGEGEAAPEENEGENEEESEEKAEPSTADSGVVDTPNDEEQIVIDEPADNENTKAAEGDGEQEGQEEDKDPEVEDEEIAELVENGNMEQLAALVLTGEGHRLVGRTSSNPELQAFIDNVPSYMSKIRAVHKAAREGNLKDLQISLDRRKFAIAKDPSSPHGATPLHVAVIFGHTPVVRYLAGRFPETAHALDLDGRTPLHYAATLADNGHYYNLLLNLGANPLVQDNFGHKADFYKENQDDLSHKQMLRDFGAPESLADEMLADKVPGGDTSSARRDVSEPETLATLERCFRLLTSGVGGTGTTGTGAGAAGGAARRRSSVPATPSAGAGGSSSNSSTAGTLLGRCLRRSVFEAIKHRVTCMDHNLFDVVWPALKKYSNAYASNSSLEEGNVIVRERRRVSLAGIGIQYVAARRARHGTCKIDFLDLKIFHDEEGRYLASSLGDPLIKGLTEVAATRPNDPVTYLASYLYNFADEDKSKDKEEDSNILIIPEGEEEEQEENQETTADNVNDNDDNDNDDGYPQSPDLDAPESLFADTERDENGQSSLHFAANRSHTKDGLYHLLQERQLNIAFRDSRYRTGRDVAEISGNRENVQEIDRFVVYLAARGETDKLVELLMAGYDHILDTEDDGKSVLQIAEEEDNKSTVEFLKSIKNYTELRDDIHRAIRAGNALKVRELLEMNGEGARLLALGKNTNGRCSLHIATLLEHEDIVRYIAKTYPETLRVGDNLERTALHYAMGLPAVENLSNILIKAGAKRVQKDLKSRQPSYYFMNKTDIKNLRDEEESMDKWKDK